MRFGAFELDPKAGELCQGDLKILLQDQPLQILLMLVERGEEIVTREEIQKKLWPDDTVVEFGVSINQAVLKLRRALKDSAEDPRYIETVARRGYRLKVPVEAVESQREPTTLTGKQVSHYRVLDVIGGGGMGVVYRAEDLKLGRAVALKFLPVELGDDPSARQRFQREAQAASALDHPNICAIHDLEEYEGKPFIVMQLLEGKTLRDWLASATEEEKSHTLKRLLDIAMQVADGLQAAHEKGIVHRDIKPANIFLTNKDVAKILDFGLAKLVEVGEDAVDPNDAVTDETSSVAMVSKEAHPGSPENVEVTGLLDKMDTAVERLVSVPGGTFAENSRTSSLVSIASDIANGITGRILKFFEKDRTDWEAAMALPIVGTSSLVGNHKPVALSSDPIDARMKVVSEGDGGTGLHLTRTGFAFGTAAYMSPEQVRGETLDARTDLFSFGLVLYEMFTGQRAFSGKTAAVVHKAILNNNPVPLRELNSALPAKLIAVIDKALEKDRERRYQNAEEMAGDLRELCQRSAGRTRRSQFVLAGIAIATLIVIAVFGVRLLESQSGPARKVEVHQLSSGAPDSQVLDQIALSPDGKRLAYGGEANGLTLLQVDSGESRSFPNTTSFRPISWLTDGEHLLISKLGEAGTWKMSAEDGATEKFRDHTLNPFPSPDGGHIAFFTDNALWVQSQGEGPRKLKEFDSRWLLGSLAWSPDGQRIAFDRMRMLQPDTSNAWGQPFEILLDTCDLQGRCSTTFSDPRLYMDTFFSNVAWLPDGRLIFSLREPVPDEHSSNLWSLDVDSSTGMARGKPKRLTDWSGFELGSLSASADGKRLALLQRRIDSRIDVAELRESGGDLGQAKPLNSDTWYGRPVSWTPDSREVIFLASRHGRNGIFRQELNDRGVQTLVSGAASYSSAVTSPDGQWLLYSERIQDGSEHLMRMSLQTGSSSVLLSGAYGCHCASPPSSLCVLSEFKGDRVVFSKLDTFSGRSNDLVSAPTTGMGYGWSLSADGKKIAFVDSGTGERVQILGINGAVRVIPVKGWNYLQSVNWSADGSHLYVSGGKNVSADVMTFAILEVSLTGNSRVLREVPGTQGWVAHAVPSPDGRHVVYTDWDFSSRMVMLRDF